MVFSDLFFLFFFLPLCLIFYYFSKTIKSKNIVLIVFSLIFYGWGEPLWVLLLLFSAVFNWFIGLRIGRFRGQTTAKLLLVLALVVNIGLLFTFKYTGFFVETINWIFGAHIPVPEIVMPIGISFFTFQALSYVIDCYWDTVKPQKRFRHFLLYLSLFPQLIAGPIVRYSLIQKEITNRRITPEDMYEGIIRFVIGLTKKVLIANNLWTIVTNFFGVDISSLSTLGTWYTAIIYTLYIYFDFSGYSDMAIGMGRLFGFHFDENFRHPYMCRSISEFWRRWHISLGSFFRDYVYIPLGGNRVGTSRHILNIFVVWFCTGMWHGASWNFIFWGLFHGFFIFLEHRIIKDRIKNWPLWWDHIYTKLIIVVGFGIFYFEDIGQLGQFFLNILGINMIAGRSSFTDIITWTSFINNIFLIIAAMLLCAPIREKITGYFMKTKSASALTWSKTAGMIGCMVLLAVCAILLVDSTNNPFLYWRF